MLATGMATEIDNIMLGDFDMDDEGAVAMGDGSSSASKPASVPKGRGRGRGGGHGAGVISKPKASVKKGGGTYGKTKSGTKACRGCGKNFALAS